MRLCTLYYSELKMTDELSKHVFKKCRSVRNGTITVDTLNIPIHHRPIQFGDHTADKEIIRRMAAPVGVMGCLRLASKSRHIFIFSRNFASRRRRREPKVNLKRYDNVYAISYREPPKQIFTEAMGALRAYNISLDGITDQIVELYVRVDMGEKTVNVS